MNTDWFLEYLLLFGVLLVPAFVFFLALMAVRLRRGRLRLHRPPRRSHSSR